VFLDRELERKAEMKLNGKNEEWERRKAFLIGKRFDVVPMCNIKSHFVTIDSRILYGIMKEICPEFDVSREEFSGENRKTYWKNIFDFKRLKVSKQKVFTGLIKTDGVALCAHNRRLNADCSVPSSAAPVTKDEDEKEAGPTMQEVQDNDFVVGGDPRNTNIITIAAPKRADDGTDCNLRQTDMRLLRLARARYYRESGIVNARKKIGTWNAEMKDHLEALSEATSRGADFEPFRKFMDVRVAHLDALWAEYTKPRWARLRMNLYCGKQRAVANFFNRLSALKEDGSQRLLVAYGAGRWASKKGSTTAPSTRTYKECTSRFVTIPIDEFRTSYTHHELGCTLQMVEKEKCQRTPEEIAKYGPLKEEQMERRAKVRGLLALVRTSNDGKKRMEFVNRDFNAAINIRKCTVLEKRPPEPTRENFIGQPLKVELYEKKLEPVEGGRSKAAGRCLHIR